MSASESTQSGSAVLDFSDEGRIATLTVTRPEKLNALTPGILDDIANACADIASSEARVVLLRSAGDRVFSVGADINLFAELGSIDMWRTWVSAGHAACDAIASLPQPTVAVVDGLAFGGGFELTLAADFRVFAVDARVALPETGLGTVPGWGGTERLTALIGEHRAKEMILTRRVLSSEEALGWGIATRLAADGELETQVKELIDQLLGSAPIASQIAKQIIRASVDGAASSTLEALAAGVTASTTDLSEGIAAFREKRPPRFRNR